jgi:precorrin-6A/cobalt-precorrin-6A reductase
MTPPRVLLLGGTAEARELAAALTRDGVPVISSLAGRVADPRLPEGEVRVGGFGGPDGLARWLLDNRIAAVVDATHPFAERISASAAVACGSAALPLLRLERPGWTAGPGDDWRRAGDTASAAALIEQLGDRVFLTTGRQGLAAFAEVPAWFLVRCIDAPQPPLPALHELLLDRGPYTLEGELALIDRHSINLLVTKDSGGRLTEAKLAAARDRGLPVIVIQRPARPELPTVHDVAAAVEWLRVRA